MRKLRIVAYIDVDDLDNKTRLDLANDMQCSVDEIPSVKDTSAWEAAVVLGGIVGEPINTMLFEGTDTYVKYDSIDIVSAEWVK
jgi:hypothetical protein